LYFICICIKFVAQCNGLTAHDAWDARLGIRKAFQEIRKGSPRSRALNERVQKLAIFEPISRRISETVQDVA